MAFPIEILMYETSFIGQRCPRIPGNKNQDSPFAFAYLLLKIPSAQMMGTTRSSPADVGVVTRNAAASAFYSFLHHMLSP
jgi:hypothetical protein